MKLLITGAWQYTQEQYRALIQMGYEIYFLQNEKDSLSEDEYKVEAVICNGLFLYHDIDEFKNLKLIQLTSAGFDRVDKDRIEKRGIHLYNARGVYSIPMAEYALCGALQLIKMCDFFSENQREHIWKKNRMIKELYGMDVLIIGCGNVGTECAKRFAAMGCNVSGVARHKFENPYYNKIFSFTELDEIISESDVIILSVPINESTKHLINMERINKMKKTAILINIARGAIIETAALITALNEKKIYGAVLDVFEEEPLETKNPLWDMKNVIITPHNSFVGNANGERLWNVIKTNLQKDGEYI